MAIIVASLVVLVALLAGLAALVGQASEDPERFEEVGEPFGPGGSGPGLPPADTEAQVVAGAGGWQRIALPHAGGQVARPTAAVASSDGTGWIVAGDVGHPGALPVPALWRQAPGDGLRPLADLPLGEDATVGTASDVAVGPAGRTVVVGATGAPGAEGPAIWVVDDVAEAGDAAPATVDGPTGARVEAVAASPTGWVAVGRRGPALAPILVTWRSDDGVSWQQVQEAPLAPRSTVVGLEVLADGRACGVVGGDRRVPASSWCTADGRAWSEARMPAAGVGAVTVLDGTLVAATDELVLTSTDGVGWTWAPHRLGVVGGLTSVEGRLLAVGVDGTGWLAAEAGPDAALEPAARWELVLEPPWDGTDPLGELDEWEPGAASVLPGPVVAAPSPDGALVVVGGGASAQATTVGPDGDGRWLPVGAAAGDEAPTTREHAHGAATDGDVVVVVGGAQPAEAVDPVGRPGSSEARAWIGERDGAADRLWSAASMPERVTDAWSPVASGDGFVALGSIGGRTVVLRSDDGRSWELDDDVGLSDVQAGELAAAGDAVVLVGDTGYGTPVIHRSVDGGPWEQADVALDVYGEGRLTGACHGGGRSWAVGWIFDADGAQSPLVLSSQDGSSWRQHAVDRSALASLDELALGGCVADEGGLTAAGPTHFTVGRPIVVTGRDALVAHPLLPVDAYSAEVDGPAAGSGSIWMAVQELVPGRTELWSGRGDSWEPDEAATSLLGDGLDGRDRTTFQGHPATGPDGSVLVPLGLDGGAVLLVGPSG